MPGVRAAHKRAPVPSLQASVPAQPQGDKKGLRKVESFPTVRDFSLAKAAVPASICTYSLPQAPR